MGGGGGKGGTTTSSQTVSIPPEVLARYNAVNARAEKTAEQPFQQYGGEFVAPLTPTQTAGIQNTSAAAGQAQPYFGAATGLTLSGARDVGPLTQGQIGYYQNPYTQAVVNPTVQALQQQQGQQLSQQQTEAIKGGAFGGDRANLQRAQLQGQQNLALGQTIAPLYQQGYDKAAALGTNQQDVIAKDLARRMQAGQQIAGLGTGAQQASLQGAQAQMAAGQVQQQTQQAQDTAQYQQFLQERGYPFQVAQFLANIAMGTGALSGSTTSGTQTAPGGFFSDKRLKDDVREIGETHDGQPIYSYKYKGDDRTQIGLMAQDVEKKHPEAVGVMGGYKTVDYKKATEDAERTHKDMGGGLMPDGFDYNSMGGAVTSDMAGEAFERGGYVGGGLVGNDDWAQIIAANKQALGVYGGQQPMGGGSPGATGIVPAANIPVPKPIEAAKMSMPAQRPSGMSTAMQTGKDIAGAYKMGKEGLMGSAPTKDDPTGSAGLIGGQGKMSGENIFSKGKDFFGDMFKAEGGLIVPRHEYADGGGDDSQGDEAVPYDPSDVMGSKDPMEGVLKAGSQKREMLKPAQMQGSGGGGGGGSSLGLGKMAGSMIGSAFGPLGSMAGSALGSLLPFADGGLVPRQGYDEGGPTEAPSLDKDPTLGLISKFEGFRERPYWDVNALRTGFGSDTVTLPDGTVQRVGENTRVSVEDAKRDLARRAGEFQGQIKGSVGEENWGKLDPNTQAALTSVTYNYGRLPKSVAEAVQSGDKASIGAAVNALGTHNEGVNARRRAEEASLIHPEGKYSASSGAPRPPGLVGAGAQPAAPSGEGKKSIGDVVTSEGFIVPALGFLGSMLASNKPNLGQALGEGIVGGVGAYQGQQKQLADIAKTKAETGQMLPVATARNIEAANKLAVGLMQYNASLPPGSKKLTLQEYAKVVGYTGPIPPSPEQTAQSVDPGAGNIASTDSRKWGLTPDEKESLVIKYPDGTAIPAYNDPSYLKAYANKFTSMGEGWAKEQADAASAAAEKNKVQTFDISGKLVTVPGAIEAGQKQKVGERLAEEAAEFNKEAAKYGPESQKIIGALNELETVLSQFRTGADAPARANLDRVMKAIDPENKFKLASSTAGDYDTVVKDAMFIGLSQLAGLSPRAPASELNAIRQTIPDVRLDPDAIRNIISKIKGDTAYKQKMYDAFDIDKNVNITKFQKEFMKDNPYDEFLKKTKAELRPGVGTQQQREQSAAPQSSEALQWARSNPEDPRSAEILKRLGVK